MCVVYRIERKRVVRSHLRLVGKVEGILDEVGKGSFREVILQKIQSD